MSEIWSPIRANSSSHLRSGARHEWRSHQMIIASSGLIHAQIFTSWGLRHGETETSYLFCVPSESLTHKIHEHNKLLFDIPFLFLLFWKIEKTGPLRLRNFINYQITSFSWIPWQTLNYIHHRKNEIYFIVSDTRNHSLYILLNHQKSLSLVDKFILHVSFLSEQQNAGALGTEERLVFSLITAMAWSRNEAPTSAWWTILKRSDITVFSFEQMNSRDFIIEIAKSLVILLYWHASWEKIVSYLKKTELEILRVFTLFKYWKEWYLK